MRGSLIFCLLFSLRNQPRKYFPVFILSDKKRGGGIKFRIGSVENALALAKINIYTITKVIDTWNFCLWL